jgi:hypothetical protein
MKKPEEIIFNRFLKCLEEDENLKSGTYFRSTEPQKHMPMTRKIKPLFEIDNKEEAVAKFNKNLEDKKIK